MVLLLTQPVRDWRNRSSLCALYKTPLVSPKLTSTFTWMQPIFGDWVVQGNAHTRSLLVGQNNPRYLGKRYWRRYSRLAGLIRRGVSRKASEKFKISPPTVRVVKVNRNATSSTALIPSLARAVHSYTHTHIHTQKVSLATKTIRKPDVRIALISLDRKERTIQGTYKEGEHETPKHENIEISKQTSWAGSSYKYCTSPAITLNTLVEVL